MPPTCPDESPEMRAERWRRLLDPFHRKKTMQQPEKKEEQKYFPTQSGTFLGYEPQWRHKQPYAAINKQLAPKVKGGDNWTKVPFVILRGNLHLELLDGTVVHIGVPFPRFQPGILETIHMCGWEQANAVAWDFAAHAAAVGATIEVRVVDYELKYDIKARLLEPSMTQERVEA